MSYSCSVIVTTYNQPEWLRKCLLGYAYQNRHDFELIVADDGSTQETTDLIKKMSEEVPYDLKHIWRENTGYGRCQMMNEAAVTSESDYLIITDGDCIPRSDFVSQHIHRREKQKFLSGGYVKLPMAPSRAIDHDAIKSGDFCKIDWLIKNGLTGKISSKLKYNEGIKAKIFNWMTPVKPRWHGHNASTWKDYLLEVNGFDERMGYGGQDLEFGERLVHLGIRGKQIRHHAIMLHLDHPRGYATEESIKKNDLIRLETKKTRKIKTEYGISQRFDVH